MHEKFVDVAGKSRNSTDERHGLMEAIIYSYFSVLMVPLWLGAGIADWLCHRREHIELTTGPKEALMHLLLLAEIGVPVLYCLFFEINAMAILICLVGLVLHEITSWWDVRYAFNRRRIGPTEQHVHGVLELLPLLGLFCVVVLHSDQFLALLGIGERIANFTIRLKSPWPFHYVMLMTGAAFVLLVVPFLEELWRCMRYQSRSRHATGDAASAYATSATSSKP